MESERAWKVSIDQIKAANYNLDKKNPHVGEVEDHDPEHLLAGYQRLQAEAQALRDELKAILAESLTSSLSQGDRSVRANPSVRGDPELRRRIEP